MAIKMAHKTIDYAKLNITNTKQKSS